MTDDNAHGAGIQRLVELGLLAAETKPITPAQAIAAWVQRRDALGTDCSPAEAFDAVGDLLEMVRSFADPLLHRALNGGDHVGLRMLRSLKPSDPEADRSEHLRLLALKLKLAARLMDDGNAAAPLTGAVAELAAINAGDEPRLFASIKAKRSKGLGTNAYRLASSQLRALEWDAILDTRGLSPSDRHLQLHQAFGAQWDTMSRWRGPCEKRLGSVTVSRSIEIARENAATGQPVFAEVFGLSPADAVKFDGSLYQQELRRRKS